MHKGKGTVATLLNPDTRWRRVVGSNDSGFDAQATAPDTHRNGDRTGTGTCLYLFREEKNLVPSSVIEGPVLGRPNRITERKVDC